MKKDGPKNPRRRDFLKLAATAAGSAILSGCAASVPRFIAPARPAARSRSPRVIFIAIDSLHPNYLSLTARGFPGGREGDLLMPNLAGFLRDAAFFPNASCFLPSATDMNHLNALAGSNSGGTGILGVYCQPAGWDESGRVKMKNLHLSMARDKNGRPVDTLFSAYKRRFPDSVTAMVSGKFWIADMFRSTPDFSTAVDWAVSAPSRPDWIAAPKKSSFADPPSDADAACDPESPGLSPVAWEPHSLDLKGVLNRSFTSQKSGLSMVMEDRPLRFPHDEWVVDAALSLYERERPDLGYILLAQADDAGHCLGAASDPSEFSPLDPPPRLARGCAANPDYALASTRNRNVWREPILDSIREVDAQFGRLAAGLSRMGVLDDALVVVLSDHSMENHVFHIEPDATDVLAILKKNGLDIEDHACCITVSSCGLMYWREKKEETARAREILLAHRLVNPQSGQTECPFRVLDRADMKSGAPGVCGPGDLYHEFLVEKDREQTLVWPDLAIFARSGWQLPVYAGTIGNIAFSVPSWIPPFRPFLGGHGSVETLPILAALRAPAIKPGTRRDAVTIADLGVTAASFCGAPLLSASAGRDLTGIL